MRISCSLLAMLATIAAVPAAAAPWWYAGRAGDRAVFVDAGSIEHDGHRVGFASKEMIRRDSSRLVPAFGNDAAWNHHAGDQLQPVARL